MILLFLLLLAATSAKGLALLVLLQEGDLNLARRGDAETLPGGGVAELALVDEDLEVEMGNVAEVAEVETHRVELSSLAEIRRSIR